MHEIYDTIHTWWNDAPRGANTLSTENNNFQTKSNLFDFILLIVYDSQTMWYV